MMKSILLQTSLFWRQLFIWIFMVLFCFASYSRNTVIGAGHLFPFMLIPFHATTGFLMFLGGIEKD